MNPYNYSKFIVTSSFWKYVSSVNVMGRFLNVLASSTSLLQYKLRRDEDGSRLRPNLKQNRFSTLVYLEQPAPKHFGWKSKDSNLNKVI